MQQISAVCAEAGPTWHTCNANPDLATDGARSNGAWLNLMEHGTLQAMRRATAQGDVRFTKCPMRGSG